MLGKANPVNNVSIVMADKCKEEGYMTAEQFAYWLNGYFEISGKETLTEKECSIVRDHLKLVFKKVTPVYNNPFTWSNGGTIAGTATQQVYC